MIFKEPISVSLPAQMLYVPMFRRFIADVLNRVGFSDEFAYKTEIVIDELCTNAILYGSSTSTSRITVELDVTDDSIELSVKDEGVDRDSIDRLKRIVNSSADVEIESGQSNMGLNIVKSLADEVEIIVGDDGFTAIRVIRRRVDY